MATRQLLLSSSLVAIVVTSLAAAPLPLVVDVSPFAAEHASSILRVTLPELHGFVSSRGSISEGCSPAELELDLDPSWAAVHLTAAAERYTLELSPEGRLRITGAGLLGLAYSIHDLREFLALSSLEAAAGGDSCAPWWRTVAAFFERGPPSPPHFALRTYSEEGQLLALPDRGYYLPDESAADVAAIQAEADALEAEVVPAILRLRMNTLTVLHSDVEDYVSYDLRECGGDAGADSQPLALPLELFPSPAQFRGTCPERRSSTRRTTRTASARPESSASWRRGSRCVRGGGEGPP